MRSFTIGGKTITQDGKPYIIAEIGNNHNGSVELCKRLIEAAKQNGADAVKLQKRFPEKLFTKKLYESPYTGPHSFGPTYGTHREALEFDKMEWFELLNFAEKLGILLFSTAFDEDSVDFLEQFDLPAYKIASGCLKDTPLIEKIADLGKPVVISTGGGEWADVDRVYTLMKKSRAPFCFLHCVASYPNRARDMNLRIIPAMMDRYPDIIIGLSDHYQGDDMAKYAYALGARIYEKHFTRDHTEKGPDHALSLEPHELQEMVHALERGDAAMGSPEKRFLECEFAGIYKMGKGLYFSHDIPGGTVITDADICIKSPLAEMLPYEKHRVIGKTLARGVDFEDPVTMEVLI